MDITWWYALIFLLERTKRFHESIVNFLKVIALEFLAPTLLTLRIYFHLLAFTPFPEDCEKLFQVSTSKVVTIQFSKNELTAVAPRATIDIVNSGSVWSGCEMWVMWRHIIFLKFESKRSGAVEESRLIKSINPGLRYIWTLFAELFVNQIGSKKSQPIYIITQKKGKLPCQLYHLPIGRDIHINHFPLMTENVQRIHLQHRAGTKLFVQWWLFLALHDDGITNQWPRGHGNWM